MDYNVTVIICAFAESAVDSDLSMKPFEKGVHTAHLVTIVNTSGLRYVSDFLLLMLHPAVEPDILIPQDFLCTARHNCQYE